ncbi:MAG: alpha-glucosidase C-terminal domain-containing protein [Verrucomicrobia bacterium]|nr:alpha-glucosidase C-terminal domain-containing protein [Verrucomicrobiota bacterium]
MTSQEHMLRNCWAELYGAEHDKLLAGFLEELNTRKAEQTTSVKDPMWYKDAVVYSLYVDLFNKDFPGLIEKLDYLKDLGATCLWLLPILDSPMKDVGFDIRRYDRVREELLGLPDGASDEEQVAAFRHFLDEAHSRGLRVIFDIALNHTSEEHEWFAEARKSKDNPYRDYYIWSDTVDKYKDARLLFKGLCPSNWEKCGDQYFFHRFYEFQPDLNYRNPNVLIGMSRHLLYWLGQGVDGFRADAIPFVWKEDGTGCENLPKAHTIVKFYRAMLDYVKPGLLMLAEACQPPHDVVEYFGNEDECHAGYHFPLMPRIFISMAAHDRWPIMEMLDHKFTPPIPESCQWFTFLRCHDELTLEMVSENERVFMNDHYLLKPEWIFREGEGISARLADLLERDPRRIGLAYSIMLTLPGTPIIYYGDEFGRTNDEAYFAEMKQKIGYGDSRFFVRGKVDWDQVEKALSDPDSFESKVNAIARNLVHTRKQHPAFGRGSLQWVDAGAKEVLAYIRECEDDKVCVLQNLSDSEVSAVVPGLNLSEAGNDLLGQAVEAAGRGGVLMPSYSCRWIACCSD